MPTPKGIPLWPLERLKPYERNPLSHSPEQVADIAQSILAFGFNDPIEVDGKSGIVSGHGRLAAARLLGMKRVPVIQLDHLTPAQRRAYQIAANKLAEQATWDNELLLGELEAIRADGIDLDLVGISDEDLAELEASLEQLEEPAPATARPSRILHMLEFDTEAQKQRFLGFLAAIKDRAKPGTSLAAALDEHVTSTLEAK